MSLTPSLFEDMPTAPAKSFRAYLGSETFSDRPGMVEDFDRQLAAFRKSAKEGATNGGI